MIQLSEGRGKVLRWLAVPTGVILALAVGITPAHAAPTDPQTVVSLTFDDGNADQATAVPILDQAGMKGTFYITTGWIGTPGYLTLANLASMAADGQEIGGHTVNHPDLTALPTEEVTREVCDGRATLASWGFNAVTSFAYPFANVNAATEAVVKGCGFNSARGLGDIESRFGCPGCGFAETIPPADPYQTAALDEVDSTWTLADLETSVTNAETAGGGWVQFTFHHICDGVCDPTNGLSITPALLQEFTAWLALRAATNNTVVKTVGQVIGGAVQPVVGGTTPPPPAPGPGVNGIANPSLETAGTPSTVILVQTPQCFSVGAFGTNTATFSTVSPGHTGNVAEQMNMTAYTDGDQKLLPSLDLGSCAPTVTPDHTYSLRVWYTATVPAQYDVYLRNTVGGWAYWTSSPFFDAAAAYTQAQWQTPAVPAGATGISFGLTVLQVGQVVTDDYAMYDSAGAPGDLVSATPTITGTAKVGEVLTAAPGTWSPATATLTYQWQGGGVDIIGATLATYTPGAADAGKALSVRVSGTAAGFVPATASATSPVTALIAAGDMAAGAPTITGTSKIGEVLTAVPGTWSPATATFAYQWLGDGLDVAGATNATYALAAADGGKAFSVRVTGTAPGYTSVSATSASVVAGAGDLVPATPTITGAAKFGEVLTAVPGTWSPASATLAYQWLGDGAEVAGATSATYTPNAADIGKAMTVQVTGSAPGYAPATAAATSLATAVVAAGDLVPGVPTITGTATIGGELTAAAGTWNPAATTFGYQWRSDGQDIAGATFATYLLIPEDSGKSVSVRVTGTASGYAPTSATSAAVLIGAGEIVPATPAITGTPAIGVVLAAVPGVWSPDSAVLTYQWLRDGVVIPGATFSTYLLAAVDVGASISVSVTGAALGYITVSATGAPVVAAAGALAAATPTIAGTAKVGLALTAVPGNWSPDSAVLTYQWLRGGVDISGATSVAYTPVAADVATALSVRVSGAATGYLPATASSTSAATALVVAGGIIAGTPTITGTAKVGGLLSVDPGTWSPGGATFGYQWLRAGLNITGATSATYAPVTADSGKAISVWVTGTAPGYTSVSATTASLVVGAGDIVPATPTVTGTVRVGEVLTAVPGSWSPAAVSLAYQWLRGGAVIGGATRVTYKLGDSDRGKAVSVRVTGTAAGYATATRTSAATTPVAGVAITATRIAGSDVYGTAVKISQASSPGVKRVYVANALSYADALSVGPAADHFGAPLLLTTQDALPAAVRAEIARLRPAKIVVVGGASVVSDAVFAQLAAIAPVVRLAGADRYATSLAVARDAFGNTGARTAYMVDGTNVTDALSAAAAAAHLSGPVILVRGGEATLDTATTKVLRDQGVRTVKIVGGRSEVSAGIEGSLARLLGASNVQRIDGSDHYATANEINQDAFGSRDTVYLAVGSGSADTLLASALAAAKDAPLFVTPSSCLSESAIDGIQSLGATKVILIGPSSSLSENVLNLNPCS